MESKLDAKFEKLGAALSRKLDAQLTSFSTKVLNFLKPPATEKVCHTPPRAASPDRKMQKTGISAMDVTHTSDPPHIQQE